MSMKQMLNLTLKWYKELFIYLNEDIPDVCHATVFPRFFSTIVKSYCFTNLCSLVMQITEDLL